MGDEQMKVYREKDVVSNAWNDGRAKHLEFIENGESHFILFFMVSLG